MPSTQTPEQIALTQEWLEKLKRTYKLTDRAISRICLCSVDLVVAWQRLPFKTDGTANSRFREMRPKYQKLLQIGIEKLREPPPR